MCFSPQKWRRKPTLQQAVLMSLWKTGRLDYIRLCTQSFCRPQLQFSLCSKNWKTKKDLTPHFSFARFQTAKNFKALCWLLFYYERIKCLSFLFCFYCTRMNQRLISFLFCHDWNAAWWKIFSTHSCKHNLSPGTQKEKDSLWRQINKTTDAMRECCMYW